MKHYNFIQGLLIGILAWGAVSIGLRYVHYQLEVPIPRVVLAPGRVLAPIASAKPDAGLEQLKYLAAKVDDSWCTWEKVQSGVGFCANIMTLIAPIISGIFSILLWRKQKKVLAS